MCFSDPGSVLSKLKKLFPHNVTLRTLNYVTCRETLHIRELYKLIIDFN